MTRKVHPGAKSSDYGSRQTWHISGFHHFLNGDKNSASLAGLPRGLDEIRQVKHWSAAGTKQTTVSNQKTEEDTEILAD